MEPFLLVERDGAVVTATLNRPDERNAISETAHSEEIAAFCADVTRDTSIRAVILTGKGKAFCAGGNVKHMAEKTGMFGGSPFSIRNQYRTGIQLIPTALYDLEVPVVAAVNGPAMVAPGALVPQATPAPVDAPPAESAPAAWEAGLQAEALALLENGRTDVWDVLTRRFETKLIQTALVNTRGRRIEAAHKLGIGRNTITRKIQELGLE